MVKLVINVKTQYMFWIRDSYVFCQRDMLHKNHIVWWYNDKYIGINFSKKEYYRLIKLNVLW